ncbi:MAG: O-antigen ligase family protein, partial [Prochlorothrix sp.]
MSSQTIKTTLAQITTRIIARFRGEGARGSQNSTIARRAERSAEPVEAPSGAPGAAQAAARSTGHPLKPIPGFQPHPNPIFDGPWHWAQLGVMALPFSVVLGGIAWMVALVWTTRLWIAQARERLEPTKPDPVPGGYASVAQGWDWLDRSWGILAIGMILSTSVAAYPGEAWVGLANFLPCFWFFAAVSRLVQFPEQLRQLARIQAYSAVPIIVMGGLALGGWISGPVNWSVVVQWPLEAGGTPPGRMAGVFAYANVLASYLVVTLGLTLGLVVETWKMRSPRQSSARSTPMFLIWIAILGLQGLGIVLTHSRNAWGVGLLLGLVTAARLGWFGVIWATGGAVAAVLWAAFGGVGRDLARGVVPRFVWARLNDDLYGDRPLPELRITQWQFAWDLTQQRPWTGWGLRNFTPLYETATNFWLGHPHNFFLMLSAELGVPLTVGFLAVVGWILAQGVVRWRSWPCIPARFDPDRAMLLTYLLTFGGCVAFNCLDITLFDYRINL